MCGIAGVFREKVVFPNKEVDPESLRSALGHRGPDHLEVWQEEAIRLSHWRLSIIDAECLRSDLFIILLN